MDTPDFTAKLRARLGRGGDTTTTYGEQRADGTSDTSIQVQGHRNITGKR